jgi:hypothetical protein
LGVLSFISSCRGLSLHLQITENPRQNLLIQSVVAWRLSLFSMSISPVALTLFVALKYLLREQKLEVLSITYTQAITFYIHIRQIK